MPLYNWQYPDWPHFEFDYDKHSTDAQHYAENVTFLSGKLAALSIDDQFDINTETIVSEALYTSWIEGENLRVQDLKSSVLNALDPKVKNRHVVDDRAAGIGRLLAINRSTTQESLTKEMLCGWHRMMFEKVGGIAVIGNWRQGTEPMAIVSGAFGKEVIHFEAPPSRAVPAEMAAYLDWHGRSLEKFPSVADSVIRAAISHVYFESIHPFEDGNGRIGRAIAEKILARPLKTVLPFSLSASIAAKSKAYYTAINQASRTLLLDKWIEYFVKTCLEAVELGSATLDFTIFKGRYLAKFADIFTPHQRKVIDRMLEAGHAGFEGGMSVKKYVSITRVARATASRDLQKLTEAGALIRVGAGRGTRYELATF